MEKERLHCPEWEAVKDVIGDLYISQNMSLTNLIAAMAEKGFDKT
jgi:hypothetical protein